MTNQKSSPGGKRNEDPIEAVKRKIFLVAVPVGILSILIVWGIGLKQNDLPFLDLYFLPLLAILYTVLTFLYWKNIIQLHTFELILYATVLTYALGEFGSIIVTIVLTDGSFSPNFMVWLPFVYILGFLFLRTRLALLISALFFLATLILGLVGWFHFLSAGLPFPNVTLLIQIYFASAFYIAVLYLVARIKERYTSEHEVASELSKLAMTDSLTQLDNRRLLNQYLHDEVNRAERHNLPLSILLFDLDLFKQINDNFGHNTGDEVLNEVAQLLRQNIRTSDPFGRWGGDEFLCLAINTSGEQAAELAERLRVTLEQHHIQTVGKVTASFGVTSYQKGDSPVALIRRADLGLYKAKADGRNRVEQVRAGVTLPLLPGEKPYSATDEEVD